MQPQSPAAHSRCFARRSCSRLRPRRPPPTSPSASLALAPLRSLVDQVLRPLQPLREQRQSSLSSSSSMEDHATKLAAGLKDFTTLSAEPEIKEAAAGLHALELAIAKAPSSKAARSELRAAVARLEEATLVKVKERAASLQDVQNLLHSVLRVSQSVSFVQSQSVSRFYHTSSLRTIYYFPLLPHVIIAHHLLVIPTSHVNSAPYAWLARCCCLQIRVCCHACEMWSSLRADCEFAV